MAEITEVKTTNAPAPMPVFSQAIKANGMVFLSGNIGLDKDTWKLVEGGIKAQTEQTLNNMKAILEASGSGFHRVVKLNIYIRKFEDFAPLNEVYDKYFGTPKPGDICPLFDTDNDGIFAILIEWCQARTCVAVLDLPFGALVEMECTALCD
ncbi:endoribonuclease L-PSP [Xylogone sp. PMI_703]|nr:endoribonuclease L-PSP [Xylogone sp. PMI_703]